MKMIQNLLISIFLIVSGTFLINHSGLSILVYTGLFSGFAGVVYGWVVILIPAVKSYKDYSASVAEKYAGSSPGGSGPSSEQ